MEQKKIPNNINISNEPSPKTISIDNIRTNNTFNFPNNIETISKNNFINNYINIPIISNVYTSYTPSEKFFDSLTSEINNYNTITLSNISN